MATRNRKIVAVQFCILGVVGMAVIAAGPFRPARSEPAAATWAAAAPGRVEARSREIKISAPTIARIAQVLVKVNDKVAPGDLLVRLDDDEALARIQAAEAQVGLRRRARNEASAPKGSANRRKAEDAVQEAENVLFDARLAFDKASVAVRTGSGKEEDVAKARSARSAADDALKQKQDDLRTLKAEDDPPLPSRLEGELNVARADLTLARTALERTRIRAPIEGVVLQVQAQPGELALPSAEQPLVTIADISSLRVRAELDERDIGKVKVGQRAVVRSGAFPGREFEGTVNLIAQIVSPGRISARGPRRPSDVDVLEVVVALTDPGPLVVGMQVDVYLSAESR